MVSIFEYFKNSGHRVVALSEDEEVSIDIDNGCFHNLSNKNPTICTMFRKEV